MKTGRYQAAVSIAGAALAGLLLAGARTARGADADAVSESPAVAITPDVVFGHKHGMALTMDVFRPGADANGAGVLFMVSGGWFSAWADPQGVKGLFAPLTDEGFTVFAVRHGSSPKFGVPEAVADVRQAVRFVRANAGQFEVDPGRLGVYGFSAGGHLSLMLGTTGDPGDPEGESALERAGSGVQAVVAWVAPTDLRIMVWEAPDHLPAYKNFPALDLPLEEAAAVSPLVQVSPDDAPALLIAGDADELVPVRHSREIHAAFQTAGVESELLEIEGAGHGITGADAERANEAMVAWFKRHLAPASGGD